MEDALAEVRKGITVDTTFGECAGSVIRAGGRVSVVSAGFREIIDAMLKDKIPDEVAMYANGLEVNDGHWTVIPSPSPKIRGLCTHCKRYWVEQAKTAGDYVVYVGNGYTDRCPAEAAHRVYARDILWDHRTRMGLDTERLTDFGELWQDLVRVSTGGHA
jgi:2-hydroxy-3-keto-5-methylthiopentenyl-1-phosphate phosphatase